MKETTRRMRAGVLAALVALLMLAATIPASADPGDYEVDNITWESAGTIENITWESSVTWESDGGASLSAGITWE